MLFEDKEINLLEMFSHLETESIVCNDNSKEIERIFNSIHNDFKKWIDSSGKNEPPPDFYNKDEKLMLEVMRIDDHAYEQRGKIINPTNQKANKAYKELLDSGILDNFPNASLLVNAPTCLPTEEDHNYVFYRENFKRIVNKHKDKIELYRKNHPNYKLIFFAFDESSMYCQVKEKNKKLKKYEQVQCEPHAWWIDEEFVSIFKGSDIDYFIWFTPYKFIESIEPQIVLPRAAIYNCKSSSKESLIYYDADYMISTEA